MKGIDFGTAITKMLVSNSTAWGIICPAYLRLLTLIKDSKADYSGCHDKLFPLQIEPLKAELGTSGIFSSFH